MLRNRPARTRTFIYDQKYLPERPAPKYDLGLPAKRLSFSSFHALNLQKLHKQKHEQKHKPKEKTKKNKTK